ncbi:MAG: OsmC family protein [Winogradskyella sp.]|uniref:OsmC family protein n=1 Tax=Winogradskyella sp. TaxID=1883156 RepID=UPI0038592B88
MLEKEFKVKTSWSSKHKKADSDLFSNSKTHQVYIKDKAPFIVSAAKEFKGDQTKHNPEDLFLSALSSCHMMSYKYLCDKNGITLIDYTDDTSGKLKVKPDGSGAFVSIVLSPIVTILEKNKIDLAIRLHTEANRLCFIANSCSVPITHKPQIQIVK